MEMMRSSGTGMVFRVNDLSIGGSFVLPSWLGKYYDGSFLHFGKEWVIRRLSGERPFDDIGASAFDHATISIILQSDTSPCLIGNLSDLSQLFLVPLVFPRRVSTHIRQN